MAYSGVVESTNFDENSSSDDTFLVGSTPDLARCKAVTRLTCAMLHPASSAGLTMLMPASRSPMMRKARRAPGIPAFLLGDLDPFALAFTTGLVILAGGL